MDNKLLSIDIADHKIRYIYCERKKNEFYVIEAGESKVQIDYLVPGTLFDAIINILGFVNITPNRIFLTISRKNTVVHQIVLPKMKPRELEQVVASEIEKIPTFARQDFDHVYKNYPMANGKNRVIYAALSLKDLQYYLRDIQKTEMLFKDVEVTPLNFKLIPDLIQSSNQPEATLIVHDEQTYLTVVEKGNYKLFYKVPVGMDQIDADVNGPQNGNALISWMAEIRRVLKSYLIDNKDVKISKLWLVYDDEVMPDLENQVRKEMRLEVETVKVQNIPNVELATMQNLSSIYSVAMSPILNRFEKNIPHFSLEHFFRHFQIKKYTAKVVALSTLCLVLVGAAFGSFTWTVNQRMVALEKNIKALKVEIKQQKNEAAGLYKKYDQYTATRTLLFDQANYVAHLNRVSWSQVFSVFAGELPGKLALTSFSFQESGNAKIRGEALSMEAIAELIRAIDESEILEKGKFDSLNETAVKNQKIFKFGILAKLKRQKKKSLENDKE